jgi:DNA-binding winged helix-turn-helix (wHTH) protein
MNSVCCR